MSLLRHRNGSYSQLQIQKLELSKMFKNCFEYIKLPAKTRFLNNLLDSSRDAVL